MTILLGTVLLLACSHASSAAEKSFLWRVSSDHSEIHLLGSVHAVGEGMYPLSPAIETAFAASDVVVLEVDMGEMATAAFTMLAKGTLPRGTTLGDVLSPETYELVEKRLEDAGLGLAGFSSMKPWMLALTLTSFELVKAGFSTEDGIDMVLYRRATEDGKAIVGLETVDFQIGIFDSLGDKQSEDFLRYSLEELDTAIPLLDEITAYWKAGEGDELAKVLSEAYKEFPELFEIIIRERNQTWLPKIEKLLTDGEQAIVVVGALHLVGKDGLVELLRARGYTVEQL